MARFNEATPGTKTVNLAGGEAYKSSNELELLTALLTSFMDEKYYESSNDRVNRIGQLAAKNPLFAAKAAVLARHEFGMRSVTHVLASLLAPYISGADWAESFYSAIIRRPDDMTEIVAYHLSRKQKMSNAMKKGLAAAFAKFDEYQLAKYRSNGKSVSLVDVMRLTHPSPSERNAEALKKLKEGTLVSTETWEAKLSDAGKAEGDKDANKAAAWKEVIERMGYMALLRNLRNIEQQAPEIIPIAAERLVSKEAIRKSLVLPFRFYNAIENVTDRNLKIALSRAADISVENVPRLEGKTLIAVDVSGSMMGRPETIARMFAAILFKACDSMVLTFATGAKFENLNPADSVFGVMGGIRFSGGGTNFHSIFETATIPYDRIIILSDMHGWMPSSQDHWNAAYHFNRSANPRAALNNYRARTGANPMIYSFDLQGYGQLMFPEQNIVCLGGWSDKIFDLLNVLEKGMKKLEEKVLAVEF
jgi:60 kDa SS-A/Ro ribonucleoprotein